MGEETKPKKGFFVVLLEKICAYRMSNRMLLFLLVLQTAVGASVTYYASRWFGPSRWEARDNALGFTVGNVALAYLWAVCTGRLVLRLKTPAESAACVRTRSTILKWAGGVAVVAAVVIAAGEHGVRSSAPDGHMNILTKAVSITCPALIVSGLLSAALASKPIPARLLTLVVSAANAAATFASVCLFHNVFFRYRYQGFDSFSYDNNFVKDLAEGQVGQMSYPLQPFTFYHTMRIVPVCVAAILPAVAALATLDALVKVARNEDSAPAKPAKNARSFPVAVSGAVAMIFAFVLLAAVADISSRPSTNFWSWSILGPMSGLATAFALSAAAQAARTSPASKSLAVLLAAGTFAAAYMSFETVGSMERQIANNFERVLGSRCNASDDAPVLHAAPAAPGSANEYMTKQQQEMIEKTLATTVGPSTTTTTQWSYPEGSACFKSTENNEVICVPKSSFCDGLVDVVVPVRFCAAPGEEYSYYNGGDPLLFADEAYCPAEGATARAALWGILLTSLVALCALGFAAWEERDWLDEEEDDDAKKRFWRKVCKLAMSKEEEDGFMDDQQQVQHLQLGDDDSPIIKNKKMDSPC